MEYATQSLSALKVLAAEINATPTGDKRSKQTWIDAIQLAQAFAPAQMPSEAEQAEIAADLWATGAELPSHAEQEAIACANEIEQIEPSLKPAKTHAAIVIIAIVGLLLWTTSMTVLIVLRAVKYAMGRLESWAANQHAQKGNQCAMPDDAVKVHRQQKVQLHLEPS
jgi:hypothetical protein